MGTMTRVGAMVWLDWRLFRRERAAIVATFLMPAAVVALLAPAFVAGDSGDRRAALVVDGAGPVTDLLERRLTASGLIEVERHASMESAVDALRRRDVDGIVEVPASLDVPGESDVVRLVGPPQLEEPRGLRAELTRATAEVEVIRGAAVGRDGRLDHDALVAGEAQLHANFDQALGRLEDPERRRLAAMSAALVGVVVLFTFMNAMARSAIVPGYRETGVLDRLRAVGVARREAALGFVAALSAYATAQVFAALATASLLIGVRWPTPLPLVLVALAVGACAGALGVLVGANLTDTTGGVTVAAPIGVVMGMVGGAVWPLEIVPPWLRTVGHLVPQAWAVDALVAAGGLGQTSDWLAPTLVLALFAVGAAALAGLRLVGSGRGRPT